MKHVANSFVGAILVFAGPHGLAGPSEPYMIDDAKLVK